MNILILGNPAQSLPVWYSAQNHLRYIQQCGEDVTVVMPHKYAGNLQDTLISSFRPDQILTFSNYTDLMVKLRRRKDTKYFCLTWKEVLIVRKLLVFQKKQTLYWFQGIVPEEDFLRTKSMVRKKLLQWLERSAIKNADKLILVSQYMKEYLERTRRLSLKDYIVIPCASNLQYERAAREKNSFIYVGGTSVWQRLDRIMKMFSVIAEKLPDSVLYLITYDTQSMMELVKQNVSPAYQKSVVCKTLYDRDEVSKMLSSVEYGFLIRDDDAINHVSSPIKLAEYLSCGVNVIMSHSIQSYAPVIEQADCGIVINKDSDIDKLFAHQPNELAALEVYDQFFNEKTMVEEYGKFIYG